MGVIAPIWAHASRRIVGTPPSRGRREAFMGASLADYFGTQASW